jgi:hypothetical protein
MDEAGRMSRFNALRNPDKQESVAAARARLKTMLYGCRIEKLWDYTVASLAASHRLPLKDIEKLLSEARISRGRSDG